MFSFRKLIALLVVVAWVGMSASHAQPKTRKPSKQVEPTSPNFKEPPKFDEKNSRMPDQDPRSPGSAQAVTAPLDATPPDNPPVPISGIGYLLALGGAYGVKKIYGSRRRKSMQ